MPNYNTKTGSLRQGSSANLPLTREDLMRRVARTYAMKQCEQSLVGLVGTGKANGAPYRFIKIELTPGVKVHVRIYRKGVAGRSRPRCFQR